VGVDTESVGDNLLKPTYSYPYKPNDGREHLEAADEILRVLRGGAFSDAHWSVRCAYRYGDLPNYSLSYLGFRVVVLPCR
jgi:formylglycine-generating enzyme required for sulfatase activity